MRVVVVGRTKYLRVESGLARALRRAGHSAIQIDDRRLRQRIGRKAGTLWLRAKIALYRPHHVILFKPLDVEPWALASIREHSHISMWYRDLRLPHDPEVEGLLVRARYAHDVFLTAGGQVADWRTRGVRNASWLPNAADRDVDRQLPPDPSLKCDVAFIGRGVSPGTDYSRAEFLCRLAETFHVRVWGEEWHRWAKQLNWDGSTAYGEKFARICASAKLVIDIQPALWLQTRDALYSSNRMVRVMSCGGFCLSQGAPELQRLFREGEHAAWYQTDDEAFAQIDRYLGDDVLRERARVAGRDHVHAHHMIDHRVHHLLTGEHYAP